jgi:hypothetical protein
VNKILYITTGLIFCSTFAFAQFSAGVKYGNSISFIYSTDIFTPREVNDGLLRGQAGGIVMQYITQPHFGLQWEINFVQKGWIENFGNESDIFTTRLTYIDIPLLGHAYFGKKVVRYFVNAGPYLGYLISSQEEREGNFDDEDITFRYVEGRDNKLDFGIRGGLGIEILTQVGMFQIEGGYNFGVASILDKNITPIPTSVQNQSVVITLGYLYMFNR